MHLGFIDKSVITVSWVVKSCLRFAFNCWHTYYVARDRDIQSKCKLKEI